MRLRNLQCLRAIAAVLVMGVHAPRLESRVFEGPPWLAVQQVFANAGVDLFFVISGFIMTTTTWTTWEPVGTPGAPQSFLIRRVQRIYPVYWVVMAFYLAFHALAPDRLHIDDTSWSSIAASLLLVPQGHYPTLVVAWSLVCEMFFYIVFACALMLSRTAGLRLLAGWIVLTLGLALLRPFPGNPLVEQIGSLYNLEFAMGILVGVLVASGRTSYPALAFGAGVALLVVSFVITMPMVDVPSVWFRIVAFGIPMALVCYGAVALEIRSGRRMPRWLASVGDASYSLYLWHTLLLATLTTVALRLRLDGPAAHAGYLLALYALTILAAILLYRSTERPILAMFRQARREKAMAPLSEPVGKPLPNR
jgi:exopolysaccharide production protein ExoZ